MLWILGGLSLLIMLFCLALLALDPKQLANQMIASAPPNTQLPAPAAELPAFLHKAFTIVSEIAFFLGASMTGSAFLVRRGRRAPTVFALVVVSLCCLWWVLGVLSGLAHLAGGAVIGVLEFLMAACVASAFGLCAFWLVGTLRAITSTSSHRMILPQEIQYPPGYVSGYGMQASMPIPPPPSNPPQ